MPNHHHTESLDTAMPNHILSHALSIPIIKNSKTNVSCLPRAAQEEEKPSAPSCVSSRQARIQWIKVGNLGPTTGCRAFDFEDLSLSEFEDTSILFRLRCIRLWRSMSGWWYVSITNSALACETDGLPLERRPR